MKIYSLEIFPFEDLFMEIFPWRFILEIFPLDFWKFFKKICSWRFFLWNMVLEIFLLKNWDFSFWRFACGDFSLKNYFGDWTFEKILMKICSWRFFLEDLFLEIFPLKFWKFLLKICSLDIFPLEYGFGDFSFEKWRIFLLKMEIFFMITKWRRWRWTKNDEDLFMMIFFFFFEKPILWMRTTLAGSLCRLLDKSLA